MAGELRLQLPHIAASSGTAKAAEFGTLERTFGTTGQSAQNGTCRRAKQRALADGRLQTLGAFAHGAFSGRFGLPSQIRPIGTGGQNADRSDQSEGGFSHGDPLEPVAKIDGQATKIGIAERIGQTQTHRIPGHPIVGILGAK